MHSAGVHKDVVATLARYKESIRFHRRNDLKVMQSKFNSFLGDVVLEYFNNASRDEDNIVDQIYIKQLCSNFNCGNFKCL